MKQTIEFKERSESAIESITSPWAMPAKSRYQDLVLKSDFAGRRHKFESGSTWFRVLPAMRGSDLGAIVGVHALNHTAEGGGRHAHPKTLTPGAKSVFDHAYAWMLENRKSDLFSKEKKSGARLLSDPLCVFWMLTEIGGKHVARLFVGSGYDGSRGGVAGLGHQIYQLAKEVDEDGSLLGDPSDPETGVQICVEKRQAPGARYPTYSVKRGRVLAPIGEILESMAEEEKAVLVPLEDVIHIPTEEEEWKLLERVLDPETVAEIRASHG